MKKEKSEIVENNEVEAITPELKSENVSRETFDINQKIDKIGADLKNIVDRLDSFEISEEEQESIMSNIESEESKNKKSVAGLGAVLVIVGVIFAVFALKGGIIEKFKKPESTNI